MRFDVLTIFPGVFGPYLETSILGRAKIAGIIRPQVWDIRDYAKDKHKTVDDTPYGGGPGMVLKIAPIDRALQELKRKGEREKRKIIVLSAKGEQFTQKKAEEYANLDQLVLICGRYEGIDQRVADWLADEEISIGPYVLAGGEAAAMVVIEAVSRLIPGVLGNPQSLEQESFAAKAQIQKHKAQTFLEYPQYTKPEAYKGWKVPKVLLSGDHAKIQAWRKERAEKRS